MGAMVIWCIIFFGFYVGVFVKDIDVAAITINAVDDPRTLNKVLYFRPPGNVYSMNKLVETWESKIGKKLEKIYLPEEELLKKIKGILAVYTLFDSLSSTSHRIATHKLELLNW